MININELDTLPPESVKKSKILKKTKKLNKVIGDLQHILYAQKKYSVLVVVQGMDASGKDGTVREVFRNCTHGSVRVHGFKKPTSLEMDHDFLWRVHQRAPEKGYIQVFNRSHYEDILIQRVNNWIDEETVHKRMKSINAFEELLEYDNNTLVIKLFLNISKDRQREKLQERINDPIKNWKHNDADWEEHEKWDDYMTAYEYALNESNIPWYVVPADKRWYRNYIASKIVAQKLLTLDLELPYLVKEEEL
jgi:PPK2 family polyphosphate:nucleotide phosphotransferase